MQHCCTTTCKHTSDHGLVHENKMDSVLQALKDASSRTADMIATGDRTSQLEALEVWLRPLAGALAFAGTLQVGQVAAGAFKQAAHRRIGATAIGAAAVGLGSLAAMSVADAVRPLPAAETRWADPTGTKVAAVLTGLVVFVCVGGRFRSLAPSDVTRFGAFYQKKSHFNADLTSYADKAQRTLINTQGNRFGCHTCGTRARKTKYIADHQPPSKFVKDTQKTWLWKIFKYDTQQVFVPQCEACSTLQSSAVRSTTPALVYHLWSLRFYHFSGFLVVLLAPHLEPFISPILPSYT